MVEIRLALPSDLDALLTLGRAMRDEGPNFMKLDFQPEKAQLVITSLISNECVLVACKDGKVIGVLCFAVVQHAWGYDKIAVDLAIYVYPAHRGSSAFVRMVRAFETIASERGAKMLELGTSAGVDNERTAELFTAMGYYRHGIATRKEVRHVQRS